MHGWMNEHKMKVRMDEWMKKWKKRWMKWSERKKDGGSWSELGAAPFQMIILWIPSMKKYFSRQNIKKAKKKKKEGISDRVYSATFDTFFYARLFFTRGFSSDFLCVLFCVYLLRGICKQFYFFVHFFNHFFSIRFSINFVFLSKRCWTNSIGSF